MCEYDYYNEFQDLRTVTVRKRTKCAGCFVRMPPGTKALYVVGKCDGDFFYYHMCQVCQYLTAQPEESPFHACFDGSDDPRLSQAHPAYVEVRRALEIGRKPDPDAVWDPTYEELQKLTDMLNSDSPLVECHD